MRDWLVYESLAEKLLTYQIARNSKARWGGRLNSYLDPAREVARKELAREARRVAKIAEREAELQRLKER